MVLETAPWLNSVIFHVMIKPLALDLMNLRGSNPPMTARVLEIALLEHRLDWSDAVQ
jgi:hypothetical protein